MNARDLANTISENEVVNLCRKIVKIRTVNPPGDEAALAEYIGNVLRDSGLQVEILKQDKGRASLIASLKSGARAPGRIPALLYNGHLDTVPLGAEEWKKDPFGAEIFEGKIWGRGASDMKAGVAAMIAAGQAIARAHLALKGDLILAFTAGEEVDSLGAKAVAARTDLGPIQAVVIPEPSLNEIFIAEKGALWLELTTCGRTAHGAMPDLGKNALLMMIDLIQEIRQISFPFKEHPLLGGFTMSINTISGGMKTNVVPDRCVVTIDMRTVPGQDHGSIVAQVQGAIDSLARRDPEFQAAVTAVNDRRPIETAADEPALKNFIETVEAATGRRPVPKGVRYYTDASTLVPAFKAPMIICGPGDPGMAHQPNESVEICRLVESAKILTLAAAKFLL
jgi:succinyl-diaminopimelate desuccinylase